MEKEAVLNDAYEPQVLRLYWNHGKVGQCDVWGLDIVAMSTFFDYSSSEPCFINEVLFYDLFEVIK